MTLIAVGLFALGLAASWVAGRFLERGAAVVQSGAVGFCGLTALVFGMPELWANRLWAAIVILLAYGMVGALLFRMAQNGRKDAS